MANRGPFVVIVGPDGSGKTTLAHAVIDRLGDRARYFHFLPRPIWRLSDRPGLPGEIVDKHTETGSRVLGWARLSRNVVKAWLAYFLAIGPAARQGQIVVGDRYLFGYIVQPIPLKFYGPEWMALLALRLIPKPDLVIVLDAPTAVIRNRKPELSNDAIDAERQVWAKVATRSVVFSSIDSPEVLVDQILAVLKLPTRLYPPGLGHITVPKSPRRHALIGTSLYGPSRKPAIGLHRMARVATGLVGGAWLKEDRAFNAPLGVTGWTELVGELQSRGIGIDRVARYRRTQEGRGGFSFLALANGEPSAFVRVNSVGIENEIETLNRLGNHGATRFQHTTLLFDGTVGSTRFAAFTPVLSGFHRPDRNPPIGLITDEISALLVDMPKPPGTPTHWRPMHGDFTPWNLRRERERLVLIDWEDAGWGPPDADITLYWAAAQALGWRRPDCTPGQEAAQYWLDKLPQDETGRDGRLSASMARLLQSVVQA